MAYNIYVLGKGVCADKTDAMCRMLKAKGIECVEAASDTHAWLFVKLNGQWTQCDPTDSLVSGSSPIGAFYTRHANATDITKWPECIEIPGL
jgi:transglutaminase-like putative cysteine protease